MVARLLQLIFGKPFAMSLALARLQAFSDQFAFAHKVGLQAGKDGG